MVARFNFAFKCLIAKMFKAGRFRMLSFITSRTLPSLLNESDLTRGILVNVRQNVVLG